MVTRPIHFLTNIMHSLSYTSQAYKLLQQQKMSLTATEASHSILQLYSVIV